MRGKKPCCVARPSLPWQALQGCMRWAMVSGTVDGHPAIAVDAAAMPTAATARRSSDGRIADAVMSPRLCASSRALDSLAYRSARRIRFSCLRPRETALVALQHLRVALLEEFLRHRALVAAEAILHGVSAGAVEGGGVLHHPPREGAGRAPL